MEITVKINESPIIKKKFINDLKKVSKMELIDGVYTFTDVKNPDYFTHRIAYEMVDYLYGTYLKGLLSKHFDKAKIKEILNNHEEKSYEKNHLAFLLKIKLGLYLKNNETINFNSFFKFNCPKIYDELDNIAELEIDSDGEFLTEEEIPEDSSEKYIKSIQLVQYLELRDFEKPDVLDIHAYVNEKGEYKLVNEYNKPIKVPDIDANIKTLYKELYQKAPELGSFEFVNLKFVIYTAYLRPERIILYASLEDSMQEFIKDFAFFKQGMSLDTECYKSNEPRP